MKYNMYSWVNSPSLEWLSDRQPMARQLTLVLQLASDQWRWLLQWAMPFVPCC